MPDLFKRFTVKNVTNLLNFENHVIERNFIYKYIRYERGTHLVSRWSSATTEDKILDILVTTILIRKLYRNIVSIIILNIEARLVDFWTRNLAYLKATNSGMLLQRSNILKTILCTVVNLLLTVLRNKTLLTASKTLIIRDLK